MMNTTIEKTPIMHKGWVIRQRKDNEMFYAYNLATDKFINPLFRTWPLLKKFINNLK